jgi:muconolactone delta-isomerase
MQFMVTVRLDPENAKAPPPKDLAEAESEVVRGLYMDGLIRQIWVHADSSGAVMIAEADSAEAAAEKFATLPLVREGILRTPEVVPLAPYWGFGPRG